MGSIQVYLFLLVFLTDIISSARPYNIKVVLLTDGNCEMDILTKCRFINIVILGGNDDNGKIGDVLQWDRDMEKWIPKSSIIPRNFHTVSVLPLTDVEPYCL